jgi:hypothetical protein
MGVGVSLVLGMILMAFIVGPVLAQNAGGDAPTANDYSTSLSALNRMAREQGLRRAVVASRAFTTQLDTLRAQGLVAEYESGMRIAVQDPNKYETRLDELRARAINAILLTIASD